MRSSTIDNILVDDCLQLIFSYASSDWDSATLYAVCQVSRGWRSLALSNPAMWSQIKINENFINRSLPAQKARCNPWAVFPTLNLMLQRSAQHPLDIRINIPALGAGRSWFNDFHVEVLASILYPHCTRIAGFDLTSVSWNQHAVLLSIFGGTPLPHLHSLVVRCPYKKGQEFNFAFPAATHLQDLATIPFAEGGKSQIFYPKLNEISLLGTFCDWTKYSGRNLTKISIAGIPFINRFTTIQLCSMLAMSKDTLQVLELNGALPYREWEDGVTIEMAHLETLSLIYTMPCELSAFAAHIRVPALKNLHIENLSHHRLAPPVQAQIYAETQTAFRSIARHFPVAKIQQVTLVDVQFGCEALFGLLTHPEPLEFLNKLGKEVRKMKFEVGEDCFQWAADDEFAERAFAAWRRTLDVATQFLTDFA